MTERRKPTPQVKMMIALIAVMLIGIALRWGHIRREVGTMIDKMFPARTEKVQ